MDVTPPVMRHGIRAFSRFSTGGADIHISCEEKDEPALSHCRVIRPSFKSVHLGVLSP